MEKILGVLGAVPQLQKHKDDSLTDRISHDFTVGLLILFSVIVSAKQYVGEPINCWVPAHFSDNWEEYANSYCWIKNTYYLPFQSYIPFEHEEGQRDMITYYQWVPLILLVQALVFYIPCMVWRTFNARSGVDINNFVDTCKTFQLLEKAENKNKALDHMTKQMYRYVDSQRDYKTSMTISIKNILSRVCCAVCGRKKGNYLVTLYLFVKLLYIGNLFGQFFLMNVFLGISYHEYGIQFFKMLYNQDSDNEINTPAFPRVTMCDFKVRVLGNVQRYSVQCVLPINLFNEIIYLFLWWWMVALGIASIFSFIAWFWRIVSPTDRRRFVKKHLMLLERITPRGDEQNKTSQDDYLTVEFNECSELLLKPLVQQEYEPEAKPNATQASEPSQDKYHDLKKLINDMFEKWQNEVTLNLTNPTAQGKELLKLILQIDPKDCHKVFKITGEKGHQVGDKFMAKLHQDGIFVLRIVGNNTNSITITEVICALWDRYCELYLEKHIDTFV